MLLCRTSSSNQYSGSESSAFLWKISGFQVFYSEQPSLCPAFKNSPNGIRLIFTLLYAWKCLYLFQMESQAECWTPVLSLCSGLWWALQTWLGLGHIGDSGYVLTRWQGKKRWLYDTFHLLCCCVCKSLPPIHFVISELPAGLEVISRRRSESLMCLPKVLLALVCFQYHALTDCLSRVV